MTPRRWKMPPFRFAALLYPPSMSAPESCSLQIKQKERTEEIALGWKEKRIVDHLDQSNGTDGALSEEWTPGDWRAPQCTASFEELVDVVNQQTAYRSGEALDPKYYKPPWKTIKSIIRCLVIWSTLPFPRQPRCLRIRILSTQICVYPLVANDQEERLKKRSGRDHLRNKQWRRIRKGAPLWSNRSKDSKRVPITIVLMVVTLFYAISYLRLANTSIIRFQLYS